MFILKVKIKNYIDVHGEQKCKGKKIVSDNLRSGIFDRIVPEVGLIVNKKNQIISVFHQAYVVLKFKDEKKFMKAISLYNAKEIIIK